jgi:hypothetical protein
MNHASNWSALRMSRSALTLTAVLLALGACGGGSGPAAPVAAAPSAPAAGGAAPPPSAPTDLVPPSAPAGLAVSDVATDGVQISWQPASDNVGVAGYRVLANGVPLASTNLARITALGLLPSTSYVFAVQAFDAAGNFSASASSAPVTTLPAVGRLLSASPSTYAALVPTLKAGDTLVLEPGNYADPDMPGLRLRDLNGAPGAPITIMGDPTKPRPVLVGRGDVNTVRFASSSHIVLRHLEVDSRSLGGDGIRADGVAHHIALDDLVIKGVGPDQSTSGISTNGGTTWNWVIRRCVIDGAGTGLYLGNSPGDQPFIAGVIENNLIINSIGYNMQIKHQTAGAYPSLPGMPAGPSVTLIRDNVFSKSGNSATGSNARPNLLVGSFPLTGPGSSDRYEIYGNFFYGNPTEGLFQGEGNIAFHHNLLVNPSGSAVTIQVHNGEVREIRIYANTIVASGTGIRVSGGSAGYSQKVSGNAVFAGTPISAADQSSNVVDGFANVASYLINPMASPGALDLYPRAGMLQGAPVDQASVAAFVDYNRDFNGQVQADTYRGAYGGNGANPGWLPRLEVKP